MTHDSRRRAIYVCAVAMIVGDTLRRIVEGMRPVDWIMLVIEFLVLVLIAYEVFAKVLRDRSVAERRNHLYFQMVEGLKIHSQATPGNHPEDTDGWCKKVMKWEDETRKLLDSYSHQAAASFDHGIRADPYSKHMHIAPG